MLWHLLFMGGTVAVVMSGVRGGIERVALVLMPLLFVIGEIGIVAGAYADASTRMASIIGFAWIVISMACWYVFFRGKGPVRDT